MRSPWTSNIFQNNREPVRADRARGGLARYLLIVLLPLVLGPLLTVALLLYRQAQSDLTTQVIAQLTSLSTLKENQIDDWATNRRAEMSFLASAPDVTIAAQTFFLGQSGTVEWTTARDALQARLNSYLSDQNNANYTVLMLASAETGEVILASDTGQTIIGQSFLDEQYFRTVRGATTILAPPKYDPRLNTTAIVIISAAAIRDPQRGPIGVLMGLIPADRLLDIVQPTGLGATGRSFVVTGDGFILGNPVTPGQPRDASEGIIRALVKHEDGNAQYTSENGQKVVGVYNWLDRLTLALLVEQNVSEAYAPLTRAGTIFLDIMAAAAVVSVVGVFIFTRRLTGPIQELTDSALRMASGDLNAQTFLRRNDEIGLLAQAFNSMTTQLRDLYSGLEAKVEDRTRQLAAAAEVGRAATSILDIDELMARALELIRERFGYYHASIFLLDDAGEFAVLRESTGEVGKLLKARGHRLAVGSNSLIGWVTANRQARVASDVGKDPFHFKNELLPDTRAEAALPLRLGDRVIGALDVQSRQSEAFKPSDLEVLQILTDQLAVAIENGRLFGRQQRLAQIEQLLFEFAGKIHQSPNFDTILENAALELGRVFGASKAVVRLKREGQPAPPAPGNGQHL